MASSHTQTFATTYLNQSNANSELERSLKTMEFCGVVSILDKLSFDALLSLEIPVVRPELQTLCDNRECVEGSSLQGNEIMLSSTDRIGNGIHMSKTINVILQVPLLPLVETTETCQGSHGELRIYQHESGIQIIRKSIEKEKDNSLKEVKATVQLQYVEKTISPKVYFILETNTTYDVFMEKISPAFTLRTVIQRVSELDKSLQQIFFCRILYLLIINMKIIWGNGWSHGDLHADNILVLITDNCITLKIIDFGNAVEICDVTKSNIKKDLIRINWIKIQLLFEFNTIDRMELLNGVETTNYNHLDLKQVEEFGKKMNEQSMKLGTAAGTFKLIKGICDNGDNVESEPDCVRLRHGFTTGKDDRTKEKED